MPDWCVTTHSELWRPTSPGSARGTSVATKKKSKTAGAQPLRISGRAFASRTARRASKIVLTGTIRPRRRAAWQ